MYTDYLIEVLSLCLRWLHLIVGIAWIGSSFYFVWLDNSIRPPEDPELKEKGVAGELWALHGGGFYNPQKYLVAPKQLPETLHWFFWPSYSTWITGFLLISTLYYLQAGVYMIDPLKKDLSPLQAVGIGVGTLVLGWLVYDTLSKVLVEKSALLFAVVYTLFVTAVAYVLDHLISGRAAYLHVGAMIATTMTANVFFVIIPAQKIIVGAMKRGEAPDAKPGKKAKQRSYHNNYLTLPVLFCMISNHYAFTYNSKLAWLVLMAILIASVLIRHFFNLRHKGKYRWEYLVIGGAILLGVFCATMPKPEPGLEQEMRKAAAQQGGGGVTVAEVHGIVERRCVQCHSAKPTLVASAPAGVVFDSPRQIEARARQVFTQVVRLKAMPFANKTGMTEEERMKVGAWAARAAGG